MARRLDSWVGTAQRVSSTWYARHDLPGTASDGGGGGAEEVAEAGSGAHGSTKRWQWRRRAATELTGRAVL